MKLTTIACSLFITIVACTSTTSTTGTPSDGGVTPDATVDAGGGTDSGASVTVACARTAVDICAGGVTADCPYPKFADARAAACCAATGCFVKVTTSSCGVYDVAEAKGIDTVTRHYFDHASGSLVAVVRYGASLIGGYVCGAGPASFDAPACDPSTFACVAGDMDASADAQTD
jgi:hypothetical protein